MHRLTAARLSQSLNESSTQCHVSYKINKLFSCDRYGASWSLINCFPVTAWSFRIAFSVTTAPLPYTTMDTLDSHLQNKGAAMMSRSAIIELFKKIPSDRGK